MGTCCDWLSSMLPLLHSCPSHPTLMPADTQLRDLAISWREGFFQEIHNRFAGKEPAEDIDITHRRVLDRLLDERGVTVDAWDDAVRKKLVHQWHLQTPWPDVIPALQRLRDNGQFFLIVLANGTTRLQLDIAQSSGIPFHMLMSSELLGITKPDPAIYRKAMDLVRLPPESCYMLAAHLYDVQAAKAVGMNTIYVHRSTEDVELTPGSLGHDPLVDNYFDGRDTDVATGFMDVVRHLLEHNQH
ncbi:haloacid dehalogenase [Lophiotrema nucula]|uniref:Haloacid dehalogenase n=1 Tax=Lophiotrema nucula TaxID=690887 RepID=A0A6A5YXV5_9PLEO|nr:haloacid dehalogenase [Lophiotrema nucula]